MRSRPGCRSFKYLALLCALACSCAVEKQKHSVVQAEEKISESFALVESSDLSKVQAIAIKKSSLDKEFLLQGSIIDQTVAPSFSGLRSRIVAFKYFNEALYMLETNQGHQITSELPQHLVLAKFPITKQDSTYIYFDFNEGMSKTFVQGDWYASDFSSKNYDALAWNAIPITSSYIQEAYMDGTNNLIIRQVAQGIASSPLLGSISFPIEVKYYLSPYIENKGFIPTKSENFDRVGFFEVSPTLRSNEPESTVVYATKFDLRKPIVYGISSNTPPEYNQALKNGVLYWNQVFGKEVLKVEDLPKGISAPNFKHNVIQWVDWPDAGSAYADAQMDPRTGEILHAQIFMTSVFAISSKRTARMLLQRLMTTQDTNRRRGNISLAGFQNPLLCNFAPTDAFINSLSDLIASERNVSDSDILRISQAYVTEVVAHEVGHTLGLRHNFAGSLGVNFSQEEKISLFSRYLEHGEVSTDIIPTTSVMEYQRLEEGTLTGHIIKQGQKAFSYDQKAISTLYEGIEYSEKEIPFFCTDSHVDKFWDCNKFDSGMSGVEYHTQRHKDQISVLPYLLIENFISLKSEGKVRKPKDLLKAVLSPSDQVTKILAPKEKILKTASDDLRVLSVRRSFSYIHEINESEVRTAESSEVSKQLQANEKRVKDMFALELWVSLFEGFKVFEKLLNLPQYSSGIGPNGVRFDFNEAEKAEMKSLALRFFFNIAAIYQVSELQLLSKVDRINNSTIMPILLETFFERANHFALKSSETPLSLEFKNPDSTIKSIQAPNFIYPNELRLQSIKLLDKSVAERPKWNVSYKQRIFKELRSKIDKSMDGLDIMSVDLENQNDAFILWVMENRTILSALGQSKT